MKNVLFLTVVMCEGYGVSVLYEQMARRLQTAGVEVVIGCQRKDDSFTEVPVVLLEPDPQAIQRLADKISPCVIVAGTSPYFEVLPQLSDLFECWAWEAGDPTPQLFPEERESREAIRRFKQTHVYPQVQRVVAISDFIRADIGWPEATLIYCGCDHVADLMPKDAVYSEAAAANPLKIGTLMRLGQGEAQYKGNGHFVELAARLKMGAGETDLIETGLKNKGVPIEIHAAGRGTARDAAAFTERGIVPHLNLSHEEKVDYLRSLDVFISLSKWEGFNLPLVEAQALGTLSLCFDVGAHPEVCPFVLRSLRDFEIVIRKASADRGWLQQQSTLAYRYVRSHFSWDRSAEKMIALLDGIGNW